MAPQGMDRLYTEEEFRRILEVAAQEEAEGEGATAGAIGEDPSRGNGYTLQEMLAVAREAGIDAAAVTRAVGAVSRSGGEPAAGSGPLRGLFPRLVHREEVIWRALSDTEMRGVAARAAELRDAGGQLRESGDWVEWKDARGRLYLGVVREGGQTRFRAIADQAADLVAGATATGFLGLLAMAVAEGAFGGGGTVTVILVMAGVYGALRAHAAWRTRRTLRTLDDLIDAVRSKLM